MFPARPNQPANQSIKEKTAELANSAHSRYLFLRVFVLEEISVSRERPVSQYLFIFYLLTGHCGGHCKPGKNENENE